MSGQTIRSMRSSPPGLKEKGLEPSPPADRRTLIRRLSYDLTGLPPTPEEIAAFEADPSPLAYEALVDRLLASPRYGEQWGRHWLDVVRFGESRGYERNEIIPNAWPFRDYVIRSFNEDKPFDRLVREHLAGDVIGNDQPEVEAGAMFLVCGPYDDVGNQDAAQAAVIRANTLDDVIRATGESFLGLTIGCARCHDHKFDPLSQKDYYALYATFAGVRHGSRVVATASARAAYEAVAGPLRDREAHATAEVAELESRVRGNASPGLNQCLEARKAEREAVRSALNAIPAIAELVDRQFRARAWAVPRLPGRRPATAGEQRHGGESRGIEGGCARICLAARCPRIAATTGAGRLACRPAQPAHAASSGEPDLALPFRHGAGRYSQRLRIHGGRPSHPELLDWLARRLVDEGWRLKPLHRLIVTSRTYRQASTFREAAGRVDGASRSLWRFPPRRLAAEEVRDTMLAVAGLLDLRMGGPGFKLYQYFQDNVATYVPLDRPGPETYRRSVYHHSARASYLDVLTDFDCPDNAFGAPRTGVDHDPVASTRHAQSRVLHRHRPRLR